MPYVKTAWNEGAAPGISAANLNHLETQYDQAKADVDAHAARTDNPHAVTVAQIGAETPAGAQTKVDTHANLTAPHSATAAPTASRLVLRDAYGRAQVAAPLAAADIARKDTVDAHANRTDNPHAVTAAQIGAAAILAQVKTVDGAGSGLDADVVGGKRIQAGVYSYTGTWFAGNITITFPTAFASAPVVVLTGDQYVPSPYLVSVSATQFSFYRPAYSGNMVTNTIQWIAIGPTA